MYKKFLNAILFGALILGSAGTITSCKDYDDEIDEINQKLNTLSSKDELAAQVSSLTSTISAAQSAAAQASTEAANALAAAKEAAAQAEQAATGAGQATGQAAEAISNAKAAATTADAAAKTATDAAAKAKAAAEDAAKAVAAGADATKAIAEAKAASEAAAKAAEEAKAGVEAAKKAAADAAAGAATAAQKAVADAQKAIAEAAEKAAVAAAKEAAAAAVKTDLESLTKRVEALEKDGKSADPEELEKIKKDVEKAQEDVKAIVAKVAGAVTSVSLVDSHTATQVLSQILSAQGTYANYYWERFALNTVYNLGVLEDADFDIPVDPQKILGIFAQDNPLDLNFTTVFEAADLTVAQGWGNWKKEYETDPKKETGNFTGLGADLKDAIAFVKDRQVNRPDFFVVRVSPTNAVLTPDMIQLVNSQGQNLDEILSVDAVEPFDGLLSRPDALAPVVTRAEQETGLWIVKVSLKEFDEKTFYPLTQYYSDIPAWDVTPDAEVARKGADTRATINQEGQNPNAGQTDYKIVNKILFAVQVNNTAEDAADRYVTSSYDLSLSWSEYQPANRLHFSVNATPVEKLNNRYDEDSRSFFTDASDIDPALFYEERTWLPNMVDVKPNINLGNVAATAKKQNADITENVTIDDAFPQYGYANLDNRSDQKLLTVVPGEKFTVTLDEYQGWAWEEVPGQIGGIDPVPTRSAVKAMYVVLDQPTAIESEPSEWQAWQTYEYTGINQVVEGTSVDITVDGEGLLSVNGDIIGFRVYGINWDGTLVDPDGRAFYVQVGNGQATAPGATEVTPISEKVTPSDLSAYSVLASIIKTNADKNIHFVWEADTIPYVENVTDSPSSQLKKEMAFYPVFAKFDSKTYKTTTIQSFDQTATNGKIEGDIPAGTALKDVNVLYTVPMINNWLAYLDNKEYKGTLTLQLVNDKTVRDLATIEITFVKKLPTTIPGAFSPKEKQIVDGVYIAYLTPSDINGADKWDVGSADYGTRHMLDFLNLGKSKSDVESLADQYEFTFAAARVGTDAAGKPALVDNKISKGNKDPKVIVPAYFTDAADNTIEVIDGKTKHHTKVEYNFGKISTSTYYKLPNGIEGYADYKLTAAEFETIFSDIYDNRIHTWSWASLDQLKAQVLRKDYPATLVDTKWANNVKTDASKVKTLPEDYIKSVIYGEESFELNTDYFLGTNSYDGEYTALLSNSYKQSLEVVGAKLTTTSTGYEEYYQFDSYANGKIKFVRKSNSTNPVADVPSTLTITVKDSYGHQYHKVVIDGFNVLKRK